MDTVLSEDYNLKLKKPTNETEHVVFSVLFYKPNRVWKNFLTNFNTNI